MSKVREYINRGLHQLVRRDDLYHWVRTYQQTQYWSLERLEALQLEEFRKLLAHAKQHVPYFRNLLSDLDVNPEDIRSLKDIQRLPLLTKDDIRPQLDQFLAQNLRPGQYVRNSTSGSTGSNFAFYSFTGSYKPMATEMRMRTWMNLSFFPRELKIWGASWDVQKARTFRRKVKYWLKGTKTLSGYRLGDEDLAGHYQQMLSFRPDLLHSYPSILDLMAVAFAERGWAYRPKAIKTAGEKLYPGQRNRIEATFGCPIFDFYGSRDIPSIAQECDSHQGLHINMENVIVEVMDHAGKITREGEGELILTHLHNYATPFIRYRIGDWARVTRKPCRCGRTLPLIEEVLGRTFDILQFPNGNRVGGTFWTLVMKSVPGIRDFRVVQEEKARIRIDYVPESGALPDLDALRRHIREHSGPDLLLEFGEKASLPVTRGGKSQFILKKNLS